MDSNNSRIAKNTVLLYFRMLFLMLVNIYASRVILQALGVTDYGIYNVVGGVVAMFSVISQSLTASIDRYITYELGKNDSLKLKIVFSTSVSIQLLFSFLLAILIECVGLWFINNKMNMPVERVSAACIVLHCSVIALVVNMISVPYNAAIVAHEDFKAFSYISILEGLLKLGVVFLLGIIPFDSLIVYSVLILSVAILIRLIYGAYCKRHFEECTYFLIMDKPIMKDMLGFSGWNLLGAGSFILRDQGVNILINIMCGPAINAARALSYQVNTAITGFVVNFTTALNPQIIKQYASNNTNYMIQLVITGAKFSAFLLVLLSLPIILETNFILNIWLIEVPDMTVVFLQLVLILSIMEAFSTTIITGIQSTGRIRDLQLWCGGLQLLNLPFSYILMKLGFGPQWTIVVAIFFSCICFFIRVLLFKRLIKCPARLIISEVLLRVLLVIACSVILPLVIRLSMEEGILRFIIVVTTSLLSTGVCILLIGCKHSERVSILSKANNVLRRIISK